MISPSVDMPVEITIGTPYCAMCRSREWLVMSAEATLKPGMPYSASRSTLGGSHGGAHHLDADVGAVVEDLEELVGGEVELREQVQGVLRAEVLTAAARPEPWR